MNAETTLRRRHASWQRRWKGAGLLDERAIEEFLHTDYPRVVNAVAMVCGSFPAAEDAVQEALLRAWTRSSRGEEIERLGAWVVTVALNLSRSGLRRRIAERRARERISSGRASHPEPSGDPVDVHRALASLPRRQREVAVLRYLLDMDTKEVANVLRVSDGTVKNSLSKARTALAAQLRIEEVPSDG